MRGIDFDELDLFEAEHLRSGEHFLSEHHFDALHHAIFHELGHLAQERWVLPPVRSPIMDQSQVGVGGRSRMQIDQLVQMELGMGGGRLDGGDAGGSGGNGGSNGSNDAVAGASQRRVPLRPDIIDLTGDDDDAEMQDQPNPAGQPNQPARSGPQRQSENQRRLRSQTSNAPPRLNRSDASYVDDQHVIVVSSSDDEDRPMVAMPRRNAPHGRNGLFGNPNHQNPYPNRHNEYFNPRAPRNPRPGDQPRQPPAHAQDQNPNLNLNNNNNNNNNNNRLRPITQLIQNIPIFQFLNNHPPAVMANRNHNPDDDIVITGERNIAVPHLVPLPGPEALGLGPIHFDYNFRPPPLGHPAGPRPAAVSSKPPHEPPKPARPGFTRDTGEDVVALCPSCYQELAYDPDGDDDDACATPAKKARSKKATAEHHFWAVKACGHVYCKRCFEHRRPSARSSVQVGFRPDPEAGKKLYCAVEDCDSEVSTKTAWVGIFM
ncbi:hypothetical protein F5X97DRAFT_290577 [Nemania serpens]|nr:hypothetical protein F5X97DRAFT_290577 [Nemania serpens]